MRLACLALASCLALAGCIHIGSGTAPGNPSVKDPVDTVPKPPPDTIRGFSLYNRFPDAVYFVDRNPMDFKCTTTAAMPPFETRGDTTFGKISFRQDCAVRNGATLYTDTLEPVLEFAVAGRRILGRDSNGWRENPPWKPYQDIPPFDLWHPFETMTTDSLLRVEFLGDSGWAYVRRHEPALTGGRPTGVTYFYVAGFGPVYVNNRFTTTVHGAGYGEIIRLIRYKGFTADRIQSDIDRILSTVQPITPRLPQ